ncbi:hypothetical protein BGW80DRAFT_1561507 [Lactifluus volemus]|nr:hypothetical protein BGW80DRAFT_1561507 [Lactifluus volemus]
MRAVRQRLRAVLSPSERSSPRMPTPTMTHLHPHPPSPRANTQSRCSLGSVDELAPLHDCRGRILPVLGLLSVLFCLHIATYVSCELAGRPIKRRSVLHRNKFHEWMWKDLLHRESHRGRTDQFLPPLATADIAFLNDDFALGGRSCRPTHHALGSPPEEGCEAVLGLTSLRDYVDTLGEPIYPALFDTGIVISSSEEVWDIEARVAQARRFGEWEFH